MVDPIGTFENFLSDKGRVANIDELTRNYEKLRKYLYIRDVDASKAANYAINEQYAKEIQNISRREKSMLLAALNLAFYNFLKTARGEPEDLPPEPPEPQKPNFDKLCGKAFGQALLWFFTTVQGYLIVWGPCIVLAVFISAFYFYFAFSDPPPFWVAQEMFFICLPWIVGVFYFLAFRFAIAAGKAARKEAEALYSAEYAQWQARLKEWGQLRKEHEIRHEIQEDVEEIREKFSAMLDE